MNEFRIDSHIKPPRIKKPRAYPTAVKTAYDAYSEAYKKVYGVSPVGFTYDKESKLIRVGNSAGVSLGRLKELTRQLNWRIG